MSLTGWFRRSDPPPPSPVPDAAKEVQRQADELHKIVLDLKRMNAAKERNA